MPQVEELISQMYLKIDGSNASGEIYDSLTSIEVDDHLLRPDKFTIKLRDPSFKWADSGFFDVGKSVEISVKGEAGTTKLITGEITSVEHKSSQATAPTVEIKGYDQSHRFNRTKQTRTFVQETDSDIAKKIAREHGLKAKVDNTREVHEYLCQDNQTNMEFLRNRAQPIGYQMYVEDDTLYFLKSPETGPQVPVLEWGINLLDFKARLTTAQQVTEVTVRGWDPKTKKEIIGRATTAQDTPQVGEKRSGGDTAKNAFSMACKEIVVNRPVATQAEADAMAQSICDELGNSFIKAEGTCDGNPAVRAGVIVELKGIGKRFSGRYRITRAVHLYQNNGYDTRFEISGRQANTLTELLAPKKESWHSVVCGIVTNNRDPLGQGRVKVKIPALSGDVESQWARVVTPMAGNGRGFEFIPEVQDEVLIAFLQDDTNYPFVLGSLWNGKDKPPEGSDTIVNSSTGKVEKRIIKSLSGHTITLDDTQGNEKISVVDKTGKNLFEIDSKTNTLDVKAGAKVEIHTDDGHKIVLDSSGISIEAANKDLTMKAMNVTIEATAKMAMKANTNLEIEGSMTKVTGKASMDLDGGPMLNVKGGLVKIN